MSALHHKVALPPALDLPAHPLPREDPPDPSHSHFHKSPVAAPAPFKPQPQPQPQPKPQPTAKKIKPVVILDVPVPPQPPPWPQLAAQPWMWSVPAEDEGGVWECHKCKRGNLAGKTRCGSCQAWRGGKREGYGKRKLPAMPHYAPQPWKCPCGRENDPKKVRCGECQKWRGGRRAPKWRARGPPHPAAVLPPDKPSRDPWTCDKCGHANDAGKVRCASCPRWRDGRRRKYGGRAEAEAAMQVWCMEAMRGRAAAGAATAGATMAGTARSGTEAAAGREAEWYCPGCNHLNAGKKSRCGSCQRWKFGKRENMMKKNRLNVKEGGGQDGASAAVGKAVDAAPLPATLRRLPSVGKRENLKPKLDRTSMVVMLNQPNMPWKCTRCGVDNGCKNLRCRTCQSWKNGKKQLSQQAEAAEALIKNAGPAMDKQAAAAHQQLDGDLFVPPWDCHKCKARVLGTKNRCPNCKSWKGGVRHNVGKIKAVPEPWTCQACKRKNDGSRSRCVLCQGWRGGGRPDVAARRAEEKLLKGNSWICDRCERANKPSKVRCGGCQRWRGGQRLDMRKSAKAYLQHLPRDVRHYVARLTNTQTMHLPMTPMMIGQLPAAMLGQTINTHVATVNIPLPVQNNQIQNATLQQGLSQVAVPMARAPAVATATDAADATAKADVGAWTCTKCTCYNLATEMQCKICDCVRDGWTCKL